MIFYFSGTGNSYAVAKQIAEHIEVEQVISLARFEDFKQCDNAERIGIVFPCYGGRAPDIVLDFKNELFRHINKSDKYIFAVITYANSPVGAYLDFKENINAWFKVKMPENNTYGVVPIPSPEKEKTMLAQSVTLINRFIEDIVNKKAVIMYRPIPGFGFLSKQAYQHVKNLHKDFGTKLYADEKCIQCKQCTKCCPVQNITFDDNPVWGVNCINCCSCVNRCPKDAIQVGNKTQNKRRYVHPDYKNIYY